MLRGKLAICHLVVLRRFVQNSRRKIGCPRRDTTLTEAHVLSLDRLGPGHTPLNHISLTLTLLGRTLGDPLVTIAFFLSTDTLSSQLVLSGNLVPRLSSSFLAAVASGSRRGQA